MFRSHTSQPLARKNRFVPQVEQLSQRIVPALRSYRFPDFTTVELTTDSQSDHIRIADNGRMDQGNVTIYSPTDTGDAFRIFRHQLSQRRIRTVRLTNQGGNDNIQYCQGQFVNDICQVSAVQGPASPEPLFRRVELNLGSGQDVFRGYTGMHGDWYTQTIISVHGGDGNDDLQVQVRGELSGTSGIVVDLKGGYGWDSVGVDASTYRPAIQPYASLSVYLSGGGSLDDTRDPGNNVGFSYAGEMDGQLFFNLRGSGGADWLGVDLHFTSGSTGSVGRWSRYVADWGAILQGGSGNDEVSYRLYEDAGSNVWFNTSVYLDGGAGTDRVVLNRRAWGRCWEVNNEGPIEWVS